MGRTPGRRPHRSMPTRKERRRRRRQTVCTAATANQYWDDGAVRSGIRATAPSRAGWNHRRRHENDQARHDRFTNPTCSSYSFSYSYSYSTLRCGVTPLRLGKLEISSSSTPYDREVTVLWRGTVAGETESVHRSHSCHRWAARCDTRPAGLTLLAYILLQTAQGKGSAGSRRKII